MTGRFICSGTIISPKYVLTASHCVTNSYTNEVLDPSFFTVSAGNLDLHDVRAVVKKVKKIYSHKHFSVNTIQNDIALLRVIIKIYF